MIFAVTELKIAVVLFFVVFVLNVLPAFAPPTWTTMSFIGLTIPNHNFIFIVCGRRDSCHLWTHCIGKIVAALVRRRLLSEEARRNVDTIRLGIASRPALTFGTFLGYALSPLPSNYSVYCLRSNLAADRLPVATLLCRTVSQLRILDKDGVKTWATGSMWMWIGLNLHRISLPTISFLNCCYFP